MNTLAERFSAARKESGFSQAALAKQIGCGQTTIASIENGRNRGSGVLVKAASIFGVSALWLAEGRGPKRPADLSPSPNMQNVESTANFTEKQGEEKMPRLATVTHLQPRDLTTIPQFDAGGSMGFGVTLPDQPGIIHNWQVNAEWLQKNARAHTGVGNLRIVTGFGDSMRPMYNPGDPLLVDCGVKSVVADGIYFFRVGDEGFIKRLQKIPTATGIIYLATSVNPEYRDFEISPDMDFEVLARVIRVWCGTDF